MKIYLRFLATTFLFSLVAARASARPKIFLTLPARPQAAPRCPSEFRSGKTNERRKSKLASRGLAISWPFPTHGLTSNPFSGPTEALFFDPFDSFEQLDTAIAEWGRIFATRPELARCRRNSRPSSSRSAPYCCSPRRSRLSSAVHRFSKARFMRVLEVRLNLATKAILLRPSGPSARLRNDQALLPGSSIR